MEIANPKIKEIMQCDKCGMEIYQCDDCSDYLTINNKIYCESINHYCECCGKERSENGSSGK